MRTFIEVKTQFEAIHCYPEAPEEVAFLRHPHRHRFMVSATFRVAHLDRDMEFFVVKRRMDEVIADMLSVRNRETWSCERFAVWILKEMGAYCVTVFEDGENGAIVFQ